MWEPAHRPRPPPVRVRDRAVGIDRRARAILNLFDRDETARHAIRDDLGDSPRGRSDDGRSAGHRLEIDDPQGFVHRWAYERRRRAQEGPQLTTREHPVDPHHTPALLLQTPHGRLNLGEDLGRIGCPRAQDELNVAWQKRRRAEQIRQSLLPRDATDEHDRRPVGIQPQAAREIGVVQRSPLVHVDAVVDHVYAGGIQSRVAPQNVGAHPPTDGDHGRSSLVGGFLDPARHGITAAQLLRLPGAKRLETVRGDDMRDTVQQRRRVPREVRVPGVGVHEIGTGDVTDDREVDPHGLDRGVRRGELTR